MTDNSRSGASVSTRTPTPEAIDSLLENYERAVRRVGAATLYPAPDDAVKERAFLRNDIRARLLRSAPPSDTASDIRDSVRTLLEEGHVDLSQDQWASPASRAVHAWLARSAVSAEGGA